MGKSSDLVIGSGNGRPNLVPENFGLVLAGLLSGLAGMVDAIGYLQLNGLFVSFMSGNSTQLAAALGYGNLAEASLIAELIVLFVLGAAAGQVLAEFTGKRHMTWILLAVTILLVITAYTGTAFQPMVFAMGALNAAMRRAGNIPISLTFVTGVLVRFGQSFGDFLFGRISVWSWLAQGTPWVGLIAGATIAGAVYKQIGATTMWIPVSLAGVLAVCSVALPPPD
jgi:uncharacterized membrane protein YoaK (UPF0700 family)